MEWEEKGERRPEWLNDGGERPSMVGQAVWSLLGTGTGFAMVGARFSTGGRTMLPESVREGGRERC